MIFLTPTVRMPTPVPVREPPTAHQLRVASVRRASDMPAGEARPLRPYEPSPAEIERAYAVGRTANQVL